MRERRGTEIRLDSICSPLYLCFSLARASPSSQKNAFLRRLRIHRCPFFRTRDSCLPFFLPFPLRSIVNGIGISIARTPRSRYTRVILRAGRNILPLRTLFLFLHYSPSILPSSLAGSQKRHERMNNDRRLGREASNNSRFSSFLFRLVLCFDSSREKLEREWIFVSRERFKFGKREESGERQGETRRDEERRGKTRKNEERQGETRRDKERRGETRRNEERQGETRRDEERQGETRRDEERRGETRRNEERLRETRRNKKR